MKHECDDHPHFRGVVLEACLRDDVPDDEWNDSHGVDITATMPVALRRNVEHHGPIYTDGFIALTIYETCYCMWRVRDGGCVGGSLWPPGSMALSPDSLAALRRHADGVLSVAVASAAARLVDARAALSRTPANRVIETERDVRARRWTKAHKRIAAAMWAHAVAAAITREDGGWTVLTPAAAVHSTRHFCMAMAALGRDADAVLRTIDKVVAGEWTIQHEIVVGFVHVRRADNGRLIGVSTRGNVAGAMCAARRNYPVGKVVITKRISRVTRIGRPRSAT